AASPWIGHRLIAFMRPVQQPAEHIGIPFTQRRRRFSQRRADTIEPPGRGNDVFWPADGMNSRDQRAFVARPSTKFRGLLKYLDRTPTCFGDPCQRVRKGQGRNNPLKFRQRGGRNPSFPVDAYMLTVMGRKNRCRGGWELGIETQEACRFGECRIVVSPNMPGSFELGNLHVSALA